MIFGETAIVAIANMMQAGFEMITEIVRGQPDAFKKAEWERWQKHMDTWDRIFRFDQINLPNEETKKTK